MMPDNQQRSQMPKMQDQNKGMSQLRLLWCLALLLISGLGCTPTEAQSYAYVATHKSNSVAVINTATNSVVAVVPVQVQPLAVAITPDGAFAYVTNSGWIFGCDSVSVIDTVTNAVVATVPVGRFPIGVAITPDRAFAYVVNGSVRLQIQSWLP
jgi:YVTN family beta-propeller protein